MLFNNGNFYQPQATQLHFNLEQPISHPMISSAANKLITIEKVGGVGLQKSTNEDFDTSNISDKLHLASRLAKLDVSRGSMKYFPPEDEVKKIYHRQQETIERLKPKNDLIKPSPIKNYFKPNQLASKPAASQVIPKRLPHRPEKKQTYKPAITKTAVAKEPKLKETQAKVDNLLKEFESNISLEHFSKKLRDTIKKEKLRQKKTINQSLNSTITTMNRTLSPQRPQKKVINRPPPAQRQNKIGKKPKASETLVVRPKSTVTLVGKPSNRRLSSTPNRKESADKKIDVINESSIDFANTTAASVESVKKQAAKSFAPALIESSELSTILKQLERMEHDELEIRQRWSKLDYGERACDVGVKINEAVAADDSTAGFKVVPFELKASSRDQCKNDVIEQNKVNKKQEKVLLELPTQNLDSVLSHKQDFCDYLKRNNHEARGKFDPWHLVDELSDQIITDMIGSLINGELKEVCDSLVDCLITDEFAEPGQHSFSPKRNNAYKEGSPKSSSQSLLSSSSNMLPATSSSHQSLASKLLSCSGLSVAAPAVTPSQEGYEDETWENSASTTITSTSKWKSARDDTDNSSWRNIDDSFSTSTITTSP